MTKEELAEQYANEKAAEFTQAIKEAYLKGYEQGELKTASTINVDGVEYVDLGLPSGLLWGKVRDYLTYAEAKNLNLPTMEQLTELHDNVKMKELERTSNVSFGKTLYERQLVGQNGNRIEGFHYTTDLQNKSLGATILWVKDFEEDEEHMIEVAEYYGDKVYKGNKISTRIPQLTLLVINRKD